MTGDARGQAFTLEGVIGTLIILIAVVLALQAVDIVPFSDQQQDRRSEALRTQVDDTLAAAADRDALREAVTCVDGVGDPDRNIANPQNPPTEFGHLLNHTLAENGNQYIAYVEYQVNDTGNVTLERERLFPADDSAAPDTAVSVTRQVVLHESDTIHRAPGVDCIEEPGGQTVNETAQLYVPSHPDTDEDSNLYTVVRIRVVAW